MPKVLIPNKSAHDFSRAREYGELIFLTDGRINKYSVANMVREFEPIIEESSPDDYILPTSLGILSSILQAMFAVKHRRLNLLLFKNGEYVERRVLL